jgi:hypothetical protein
MTQENREKPERPRAMSVDLRAKVRLAAALQHLTNATDSQLGEEVGTTAETIAEWKRTHEWDEVLQEIANKQIIPPPSPILALTNHQLQALRTALPNASRETRENAARAVLELMRSRERP